MAKIERIVARKIFNGRGDPTVEIDIYTEGGFGRSSAPSGASCGKFEAKVTSVEEAIDMGRRFIPKLIGMEVEDQAQIDGLLREFDGTSDFSKIGGNLAITISMAAARAAASSLGLPLHRYLGDFNELPYPLGNVIGGGVHADAMEIQEFLVIPTGAESVKDAVSANASVHKETRELLRKRGMSCGKGDEGAWAPNISNEDAFDVISEAADIVSKEFGFEMRIGVDIAASELWDGEFYVYKREKRDRAEQILYVEEIVDEYDLYYVEDPLEEEDYNGFARLSKSCLICGDDLFVTNQSRIRRGAEIGSGNAVLIKPNQVGTLTDAHEAVTVATRNGYECVISHRSGETTDETIAHLAVGWKIPIIKTGIVGGERIAKLNELIRIEEELEKSKMARLAI
jgi:enolase